MLAAGSEPVPGPERLLERPGAACEGLDNIPVLHDRVPRKHFLLMSLAKYPEKFARKYRQKCPESCTRLRRHAYLHLDSDLYLYLNLDLNLNLNLFLFLKSFQDLFRRSFASLFGQLFNLKYR
jgi:hypothetical protein